MPSNLFLYFPKRAVTRYELSVAFSTDIKLPELNPGTKYLFDQSTVPLGESLVNQPSVASTNSPFILSTPPTERISPWVVVITLLV